MAGKSESDKIKIRQIKKEVNSVKSKLSEIEGQIREYSCREADALEKIMFRLEVWQNK